MLFNVLCTRISSGDLFVKDFGEVYLVQDVFMEDFNGRDEDLIHLKMIREGRKSRIREVKIKRCR